MRANWFLAVDNSGISGHGVFATRDIQSGSLIHRMNGKRASLLQCVAAIAKGSLNIDDPLQISRFGYIVLDEFSNRFNHSCEPNAALVNEADLVTVKPIAAGDEITFDYSLTVKHAFYTAFWRMPCRCGKASCRGEIGDIASVPERVIDLNVKRGTLQAYILSTISAYRAPISESAAQ